MSGVMSSFESAESSEFSLKHFRQKLLSKSEEHLAKLEELVIFSSKVELFWAFLRQF